MPLEWLKSLLISQGADDHEQACVHKQDAMRTRVTLLTLKLIFQMCVVIMIHELLSVLYLWNAEAAILWRRGGGAYGGLYINVRSTGSVTRANLRDRKSGTVDLGP